MEVFIWILLAVHIFVCALLVGAVLMQLPRSEGLGTAFGGGAAENVFGAQTTHVLAKLTVWLGVAFFVITLVLAIAYANNQPSTSTLEKDLLSAPIPEATPAAAAPADALPTTPSTEIKTEPMTLQPGSAPSPTPFLDSAAPANP